jgi:hypothetical protein
MQTVTRGRLLAALNFALAIGLDLVFRLFSWLYGTSALHPREELLLAIPSWFGVSFALLSLVIYYEDLLDEPPTVRITPNACLIVSSLFLAVGAVLMIGAVAMIVLLVKP